VFIRLSDLMITLEYVIRSIQLKHIFFLRLRSISMHLHTFLNSQTNFEKKKKLPLTKIKEVWSGGWSFGCLAVLIEGSSWMCCGACGGVLWRYRWLVVVLRVLSL